MNFVDVHTHFLPAIDDGPATLTDTLEMLRAAHASGTRTLVATPHMFLRPPADSEAPRVRDCFAKTVSTLQRLSQEPPNRFLSELTLYLGAENMAGPEFLEALSERRVLTLNGGRYILVEFPVLLPAGQFSFTVDRVLSQGLVPVLAHVERYRIFQKDPALLSRFLEQGCLSQINADSVLRSRWSGVGKTAAALLKKNLVSVIASDGHGIHRRSPNLSQAAARLKKSFSHDEVARWMVDHPQWVVASPPQKEFRPS